MQSLLVKGDRGMLRIELVDAPSQEGLLEAVPDIPIETGPLRRNGKLGIQHTSNFGTVLGLRC